MELLQIVVVRRTCSVSSEPLPVRSARILDYKGSPETGVVFDMEPPSRTIFSRVNISYTEGEERRSMLYKGAASPDRLTVSISSCPT